MLKDVPSPAQAAIRTDLGAIFVSLELSRRAWLVTSLSPGGGEKMSKHSVQAGDIAGLLKRFAQLKEKARARTGRDFPIIVIVIKVYHHVRDPRNQASQNLALHGCKVEEAIQHQHLHILNPRETNALAIQFAIENGKCTQLIRVLLS